MSYSSKNNSTHPKLRDFKSMQNKVYCIKGEKIYAFFQTTYKINNNTFQTITNTGCLCCTLNTTYTNINTKLYREILSKKSNKFQAWKNSSFSFLNYLLSTTKFKIKLKIEYILNINFILCLIILKKIYNQNTILFQKSHTGVFNT